MAYLAIALYLLFLLLALGGRIVIHRRRTGSSGVHGVSGQAGMLEWIGGILIFTAAILALVAPLLTVAGVLEPIATLDHPALQVIGIVIYSLGLIGTMVAQGMMGTSWRVGVDVEERSALVTDGLFTLVRNPIFTAMITAALGLMLMVPNPLALAAVACLIVATEIQTRFVEEPYLLNAHGDNYARYAQRVGRFMPLLGRLRTDH